MMRIACLPVLLFAISAVGQAVEEVTPKQSAPATSAPAKAALSQAGDSQIAADASVIVINGLCDTTDVKPRSRIACKTVITRAQFDALADAIQPHMDPTAKAQLAASYPRLLLMEREFRMHDLENDAQVKPALAYEKLRAEAEQAEKVLKARISMVTDPEIQKYYDDNPASFQEAELQRLYVPFAHDDSPRTVGRRARPDSAKPDQTSKPADDPLKSVAEALRARAVAGENLDNLQAEAYRAAGVTAPALETNIGKHTAEEMSADHRQLISMDVGQVSQVMNGPNGYYIYKVVSKNTRPLSQVRAQIISSLGQQKFADLTQKIDHSVKTDFNSAYFVADPLTVAPATANRNAGLRGAHNTGASVGRRSRVFPTVPPLEIAPQRQTPPVTSPVPAASAPAGEAAH
jgi:hypothetical protein